MRVNRLVSTGMAVVCLAIAAGCNGDATAKGEPPPTAVTTTQRATPEAAATKPLPSKPNIPAQLFIDTSGSMAGFFGGPRDPGAAVVALHEELDAALAESGLASVAKCTVGAAVKCDGIPRAPAKLASAALYHEQTSRLDKVIARAPSPKQVDPNTPPVTDTLDNARITLLVTDGMEVAESGGSGSCANGADPRCIASLLQQRIAEGFGIWLIGVLLPFDGVHFPERALSTAYFAQARAHVDQLKFDPRNLGVAFAIPGELGSESNGKSTYRYRGYKPLLIFAFSREPAMARQVIGSLVHKLRGAPIRPGKMTADDTVQSVELAPLDATATKITKIELMPAAAQRAMFGSGYDASQLAELKLNQAASFDGGVAQKIWCGARGRSMLYVDYEQAGERPLPAYIKEQVALVAPANAPARSVAPPQVISDKQIQTGLNCGPLPTGPNIELDLVLETQLSLDGAVVAQQWWSHDRWSSADAWQMPERAYGLEALVLPILQDRVSHPTRWNRAALHVARE